MLKLFKLLIGILLLPACWAVSRAVYLLSSGSSDVVSLHGAEVWALPAGFFLWILLFFLLPRPVTTYVLGHELTHALWALLMGARVGKMKVGKSGGHVEISKSNFLITLAPYFFPFYTFLIIAIYYLCGIWLNVASYKIWWIAAVGFTWSFHLTFTIHMLATEKQPDVQEHGSIFSYTVIYLMNVLLLGFWMVLVGVPTFALFGELLLLENTRVYLLIFHSFVEIWQTVSDGIMNWVQSDPFTIKAH